MNPQLLSKYGNAGRIARWIFENIEDPLDHWEYGCVTSAGSEVKLAIGDTVVTLENKWWGVRGSITQEHTFDSLLELWNLKYLWAPEWLREEFSFSWGTKVLGIRFARLDPFCLDEERSSGILRAVIPHKVY